MRYFRFRHCKCGLVVVAAALVLAACGHMPVTSMIKLARVDFAKTDPEQVRAAVKLPRTVRPISTVRNFLWG